MKNFILGLVSIMVLAFSATAQLEYRATPFVGGLPVGSTNSFIVDTRNTSGLALQVAFAGSGANTTTAIVGVTNAAGATNGQTFTIYLGGTTNTYTWTNSPQLLVTNYSLPATNLVLGVTNSVNGTNGATFSIILNNQTNVFTFTTPAMARTDVSTNAPAAAAVATNIAISISRTFFPRTVTVNGTVVTLTTLPTDYNVGELDFTNLFTNTLTGFYTVTNIVATNSMQLQQTNNAGYTATNLFNRLTNDFAGTLTVSQTASNILTLVTVLNPGMAVAASGLWSTNVITTNNITGFLNFQASNSLDKITWVRQSARDFTAPYAGTTNVTFSTNYTDLFAAGWWSWAVGNSTTNYANAVGIQILSAIKQGL